MLCPNCGAEMTRGWMTWVCRECGLHAPDERRASD